jgi:hypothetical protein
LITGSSRNGVYSLELYIHSQLVQQTHYAEKRINVVELMSELQIS